MNVYGEEHDGQAHILKRTFTDMQHKFCGDCYDIHLIQSQVVAAEGSHLCTLAF